MSHSAGLIAQLPLHPKPQEPTTPAPKGRKGKCLTYMICGCCMFFPLVGSIAVGVTPYVVYTVTKSAIGFAKANPWTTIGVSLSTFSMMPLIAVSCCCCCGYSCLRCLGNKVREMDESYGSAFRVNALEKAQRVAKAPSAIALVVRGWLVGFKIWVMKIIGSVRSFKWETVNGKLKSEAIEKGKRILNGEQDVSEFDLLEYNTGTTERPVFDVASMTWERRHVFLCIVCRIEMDDNEALIEDPRSTIDTKAEAEKDLAENRKVCKLLLVGIHPNPGPALQDIEDLLNNPMLVEMFDGITDVVLHPWRIISALLMLVANILQVMIKREEDKKDAVVVPASPFVPVGGCDSESYALWVSRRHSQQQARNLMNGFWTRFLNIESYTSTGFFAGTNVDLVARKMSRLAFLKIGRPSLPGQKDLPFAVEIETPGSNQNVLKNRSRYMHDEIRMFHGDDTHFKVYRKIFKHPLYVMVSTLSFLDYDKLEKALPALFGDHMIPADAFDFTWLRARVPQEWILKMIDMMRHQVLGIVNAYTRNASSEFYRRFQVQNALLEIACKNMRNLEGMPEEVDKSALADAVVAVFMRDHGLQCSVFCGMQHFDDNWHHVLNVAKSLKCFASQ